MYTVKNTNRFENNTKFFRDVVDEVVENITFSSYPQIRNAFFYLIKPQNTVHVRDSIKYYLENQSFFCFA